MSRIGKYLVFLIICLCLFLISCSNKSGQTDSHSIAMPLEKLGISEHGILTVIDDVLWFHDFESGNKIVLCNKPNCTHQPFSWDKNPNPTCNAVLPNGDLFDAVGMYNDHVYIFSSGEFNHSIVYQENLDGTGRESIAEFDWQVDKFDQMTFKDNQAFFIAVQEILDEEGQPINHDRNYIVMSLDLDTGKTTELTELKHDHYGRIHNLKVYDDRLYYAYEYYDDEMDWSDDDAIEKVDDYIHYSLYKVDLSSQQEELVMDLGNAEEGIFTDMDEDNLYFSSKDRTKVLSVSLKDLTSETLFEGSEISLAPKVGNGLLYSQHNIYDGTLYYYDFSTKKSIMIQRPSEREESHPILTYGDWIITVAKLEDGDYYDVGIKINDYLEGKSEYNFIDKINNSES